MDKWQLITILQRSERAVGRALTVLYASQTGDEQSGAQTRHLNGVGFNAMDAAYLSSLARQVGAGRSLSRAQLAVARRALPKYTRQLLASGVAWEALDAPRHDGDELRAMEALAMELNGGAAP